MRTARLEVPQDYNKSRCSQKPDSGSGPAKLAWGRQPLMPGEPRFFLIAKPLPNRGRAPVTMRLESLGLKG